MPPGGRNQLTSGLVLGRLTCMNLSEAAKKALINAGTSRQGAEVFTDTQTAAELQALGLVKVRFGLTRTGTIARDRAVAEALDGAFGA